MPLSLSSLPTNKVDGDASHTTGHNATNTAINTIATYVDASLATTTVTNALDTRLDTLEATAEALPSTYAPLVEGATFIPIGSSIELTASNAGNVAQNILPEQWPTWAEAQSRGRLKMLFNAGVSGNTTTQMLARFQTDVIDYSPLNVIIGASPNDTTVAETTTNMAAMATLARANSIRPIFCTRPPSSDVSGSANIIRDNIHKINGWIKDYATTHGIPVLDFYSVLVDPASATAHYLAAYEADVTHPNGAGHRALGIYAAEFLADILPPRAAYLAATQGDPTNLATNALMIDNTAGVADGWNHDAVGTGTTPSIVTGDTTIAGNWFKVARSGTDIDVYGRVWTKAGTWATGDVMELSYLVDAAPTVAGNGFNVNVPAYLLGTTNPSTLISIDVNAAISGLITGRVTMDSAATHIQMQIRLQGGAGYCQIAQLTLRNLTALGLA